MATLVQSGQAVPALAPATRVLFIMASLEVGGAEMGVVNLLRSLDRRQFDVAVCCLSRPGPLSAEFKELGVDVHILGRRGRWDPATWWRVAKFLMSFKPDIVHAVQFTAGLWTAVPSRVSGVGSFVYSLHGMPSTDRRYVRVLERLFIYPFADQVLSVSTAAATEFERRYPRLRRPVRVIANGVDASKFGCLPHRREATAGPIVISVGRLDPLKDFGTLVEAFALVSREVPSARLWIVGEGTERSALERKVGALGLGDTVELLGYRADIHMLLQQADVFVSTSISECLPNVHLEAMASGKAIVATKVGGVGEILDETTAILVAPGDVEAVGVAITNLLTDRALAHRLATSARAQVDAKWDFRHRVRRIQSFYKELTAVGA